MRHIDLQSWPRRKHFEFFSGFDHPHFSMCANLEVASFRKEALRHGVSISVAICYVLARAANDIPEFRYRIRGKEVIEHEIVHPAMTVLADDDIFSFCIIEYQNDFREFAAKAVEMFDCVKENPTLYADEELNDNLLYMTAIPWVSFTSFSHPMHLNPADSVPRFAWGKIFEDGDSLKMPLDVQGHHALMDGLHVGRYYAKVEELFSSPEFLEGIQ